MAYRLGMVVSYMGWVDFDLGVPLSSQAEPGKQTEGCPNLKLTQAR